MNLIIDVGNTHVKLALFKGDRLEVKEVVELEDLVSGIKSLKQKYNSIKKVILSSVGKLEAKDIDEINKHFDLQILDANTKWAFTNLYRTPSTLGIDRMVLVNAAIKKFPNKNTLIIDAGTCITYDFVTHNKAYLGGAISPGIRMRYKSLNNFTASLPLLETELPEALIGNSTNNAIHSGVVNGVLKEIDGLIADYKQKYSDLTVILTGGDANFLSKQLKSSIFVNSNFLLEGLNYILQFNTH